MVCAVDRDRHSADTLYLNHNNSHESAILCRDVKGILRDPELIASLQGVPIVAGGPPCQAFSMARRHSNADKRDPRRRLVIDFVRVAKRLNPIVVIMENVPGIRNAQNGEAFESILRAFRRAGFAVGHRTLNAAEFAVPQKRERVFFMAVNRIRVRDADELLDRVVREVDRLVRGITAPTVRQALCGLPRLIPAHGALVINGSAPGRATSYAKQLSNGSSFIFNHTSRPHNARDIGIFTDLRWGETARKFEARNPGRIPYSVSSFGDKYRKLHPGKPSPTIPSHLKRDANSFIHPFVPRGITPREAARLQSFPDDYVFLGGFGPSFVQIGNAVPPLLAEALGRAVAQALS
jgi:DNA (cytosine-5)-methyltransferase 1